MSRRWRIAGLIAAAVAFVQVLSGPSDRYVLAFWPAAPPVISAVAWASSAFVSVWVLETAFIAVRWMWRVLSRLAS